MPSTGRMPGSLTRPDSTYVVGWSDLPRAVVVGFAPNGCFAYYITVSRDMIVKIAGNDA